MKSISSTLAFTFVAAVTFIYLFLAVAMVPYWQTLDGTEIQIWWSGPFTNFSTIMVPIHLLSMVTITFGFIKHRQDKTVLRVLWIVALVGLFVCQGFNFIYYGGTLNPALQSGNLSEAEAIVTFDDWDFYQTVRTAFAGLSLIALMKIVVAKK